jgi:hypothetical protein
MDCKIKFTNWETNETIKELSHHTGIPLGLILSTKEDILFSAGTDNQIFFINLKNDKSVF